MITLLFLMILHLREFCSLWMTIVRKQRVLESDLEIWRMKWIKDGCKRLRIIEAWHVMYSHQRIIVFRRKTSFLVALTGTGMKAVKLPFWFLVGLGKTKLKWCVQVGVFGFTWEKTEDNKRDKQLRNYCVKENFNSEKIMRTLFHSRRYWGIAAMQLCQKTPAGPSPGGV